MTKTSTGQLLERKWRSGRTYAVRVHAHGRRHYLTLGSTQDGWTRPRAEAELQNILADIRRGIWTPPRPARSRTTKPTPEPDAGTVTFHEFASRWLAGRRNEISPRTHEMYKLALTHHLLPHFAHDGLEEITIEAVDAYRRHKVAQSQQRRAALEAAGGLPYNERPPRPLLATTINKTIDVLQMVLAQAVEYGHIPANPAAGKRRRLKRPARRPVHLDSVEQIQALLDAAHELDSEPVWRIPDRRAILTTLVLAGPRAHELCQLRWRDVDLANGRIHIGRSKTQAGLREIPLLPLLRDELATHKAKATNVDPDEFVFPTDAGTIRDKDNLRNRVLAPVIGRADKLLIKREQSPLPAGLTPHKLRHTYASVLVALGEDPASVMAALGHTDPKFTLRVYAHLMRRDPGERARLRAVVEGHSPDCDESVGHRRRAPADARRAEPSADRHETGIMAGLTIPSQAAHRMRPS
jgi:integrase